MFSLVTNNFQAFLEGIFLLRFSSNTHTHFFCFDLRNVFNQFVVLFLLLLLLGSYRVGSGDEDMMPIIQSSPSIASDCPVVKV